MITKIIHLSDLHIGKTLDIELKHLNSICNQIIKKYGKHAKDTIIIITGDIVNDGDANQFQAAIIPLTKLMNKGFTLWPIPGNHDYGSFGIIPRRRKERSFKNIILSRNTNSVLRDMKYPQCLEIPGKHLYLYGLNTMLVFIKYFQVARGRLGIRQILKVAWRIRKVKKHDKKAVTVVFLHHHPFKLLGIEELWMKLKDGRIFMRSIRKYTDILLFGHDHWHFDYITGTNMKKKYKIDNILSCTQSTNPLNAEFPVNPNGEINVFKVKKQGRLAWEIDIDKNQKITFKSITF